MAHPGLDRTYGVIVTQFAWEDMKRDITHLCKNYHTCQRTKIVKHNRLLLLKYIPPHGRFRVIHDDLLLPLTESEGFKHVLVITDHATRYSEFIPLKTTSTTNLYKFSVEVGFHVFDHAKHLLLTI